MSAAGSETYYQVLGVAYDATSAEITEAYRLLVRRHADDKPRFDLITEAYMTLADAHSRKEYDQRLGPRAAAQPSAPAEESPREDERLCPSCGSKNAAGNHFCGVCGLVIRSPGGSGRPKLGIGVIHLPDGSTWTIEHGEVLLGRSPKCTVTITGDRYVSSEHARIQCLMGIFTVQDLGSTNGSFLNGERLAEGKSVKLQDGDVLVLGRTEIKVEIR